MRVGLLITTFNRPNYLRQCLASVKAADIPEGTEVLIVDDASTDQETIDLLHESGYMLMLKKRNGSIKESLLMGCDFLFNIYNCDIVTNLDGDAIVRKDFLTVLLKLDEQFPEYIKTGFNCLTKNKNGTERHKILSEGDGWNKKATVGGLNMMFDKECYKAYIRPALEHSLEHNLNWDHQACIASGMDNKEIVCAVPSVCQHIGIESSMGHSAGGEPPDVAEDFPVEIQKLYSAMVWGPQGQYIPLTDLDKPVEEIKKKYFPPKLSLPQITLVGADCVNLPGLSTAIALSSEEIEFGKTIIFSSDSYEPMKHHITRINPLKSKGEYSVFMMKQLAKYITTDYVLVVQADGYVMNAAAWNPEWLKYDYIGAPWFWYKDGMNTGNGGFSLRSRRLHQILMEDNSIIPVNEEGVTKNMEEDHCICRIYRKYLEEKYGIKFAPMELAKEFSIEAWRNPDPVYRGQFGFHGGGIIGINK